MTNTITVKYKNQHEWGVIAQCHAPYREFAYCPLCKRYDELGQRMTTKQFRQLWESLKANNPMYHPDSDELLEYKP